jgi:hypothetical protein
MMQARLECPEYAEIGLAGKLQLRDAAPYREFEGLGG